MFDLSGFIKKLMPASKKGVFGDILAGFATAAVIFVVLGAIYISLARVNDNLDDGLTGTPLDIATNATEGLANLAEQHPNVGTVLGVAIILAILIGLLAFFKFRG